MDEDSGTAPTRPGKLRLAQFMYNPGTSDIAGEPAPPTRNFHSRSLAERQPASAKRKLAEDADAQSEEPSAASSSSPSPKRLSKRTAVRNRSLAASKYAPPSTYAHLALLPDAIAPNLLVLFVGLNPGVETARSGHAYAHPSNLFWKLMYSSGVLPEQCAPDEDRTLPARFQLGLTNIVSRPSRNGGELKAAELDDGVAILEDKARRWRPEVMCMVGKGIWDSIVRVRARAGRPKPVFKYGWQSESENLGAVPVSDEDPVEEGVRMDPDWKGARVFVASSTSGLAASLRPAEKEAIWRQLGEWVEIRRKEIVEAADER
ncbi:mismatch-specific thymine-dna glycosylate [Ophiostoma piceae UAMH 11346]|uniref:Mismatch-specific thymine-dna glycosylate n=1 Tax=Ophiostoma piceae (strain UAMH 11346) TaxID=1262450 RepID=S3C4D7_OPHP1|nr:mismatch-specific thymine-dna glycosylate [Ophiostoma piceae UAMH 11346]